LVDSPLHDAAGSQIQIQITRRFETDIKNISGCDLGAPMGLIHEKKDTRKSRATVPLSLRIISSALSWAKAS
jgi:hypothetical protein